MTSESTKEEKNMVPKSEVKQAQSITVLNLPFGDVVGSYVVIKHGSEKYKTSRLDGTKSGAIQWDDRFEIQFLSLTDSLAFELRRRRPFFKCISFPSRLLGTSQVQVRELAQCRGQGVEVLVNNRNIKFVIRATSDFKDSVEEPTTSQALIHSETPDSTPLTKNTSNTLQVMQTRDARASEPNLPTRSADLGPNMDAAILKPSTLSKVVEAAEPVMQVLERLSKVHPIAELAWIAVSGIYEIVKAIDKQHQDIVALYKVMLDIYQAATQKDSLTETLKSDGNLRRIFDAMVKHSMDSYMVISDYLSKSVLRRIFQSGDVKNWISEYTQIFKDLEKQLSETQIKVTTVSVLGIKAKMEQIDRNVADVRIEQSLELLKKGNTLPPKSHCLQGTRRNTVRRIMDWVMKGDEPIFWLFGVAGSGKSSLMGTLHNMFVGMGFKSRLAAFIRFDRNDYNNAGMFIQTLAYKLAHFDHRLAEAIVDALAENEQIVDVTDLSEQLDRLILGPLKKHGQDFGKEGSIVIIVDGLDECTHSDRAETDFRDQLLKLLVENPFRDFPFVRLVLASRPEEDINRMLAVREHIVAFPLDITTDETKADIKYFLEHKLSETGLLHPGSRFSELYHERDAVNQLSIRASGLFIWASTVVAFIAGYPEERLRRILDTDVPVNALQALNTLYTAALDSVAGEGDSNEDIRADIRVVLGRIMAVNSVSYVTSAILDRPCTGSSAVKSVNATRVLEKLWSVVQKGEAESLSFLHKSFDDFLTDHTRCPKEYYIDVKEYLLDWTFICTSYLIDFLKSNVEYPRDGPESEADHLAFLDFAIISWSRFLKKLSFQDLESRSDVRDALKTMLQTYLLRLMYLTYISELTDEEPENHSDFGQLICDGSEFITCVDPDEERTARISKRFQWLCHKRSGRMYNYYMPVFVKMASGSRRYPDIIEAIEKDLAPPILDSGSLDVDSLIEILEIPEKIILEGPEPFEYWARHLPDELWQQIFDQAADEDVISSYGLPTNMAECVWYRNGFGEWALRTPQEAINLLQRQSYATKKTIMRTCRTWRRVGSETFFRCLFFSDAQKLILLSEHLKSFPQRSPASSPGWWTRRLHLARYNVSSFPNEESFSTALSTILSHTPNLQILIIDYPLSTSSFSSFAPYLRPRSSTRPPSSFSPQTTPGHPLHTLSLHLPFECLPKLIWALDSLPNLVSLQITFDQPTQETLEREELVLGSAGNLALELKRLQQLVLKGGCGLFLEQAASWEMPSLRGLGVDLGSMRNPNTNTNTTAPSATSDAGAYPDLIDFLEKQPQSPSSGSLSPPHGLKLIYLDINSIPPMNVPRILEACPRLEVFCFNADWKMDPMPQQQHFSNSLGYAYNQVTQPQTQLTLTPHSTIHTIGLHGLSYAFGVGYAAAYAEVEPLRASRVVRSNDANFRALGATATGTTYERQSQLRQLRVLSRGLLRDLEREGGPGDGSKSKSSESKSPDKGKGNGSVERPSVSASAPTLTPSSALDSLGLSDLNLGNFQFEYGLGLGGGPSNTNGLGATNSNGNSGIVRLGGLTGMQRWETYWDQCSRLGVRLEDCTGEALGELPEDSEDEYLEEGEELEGQEASNYFC
ncbi:hypothetical protein D9758_002827 [Tetrapyrgos nigripes]|uniref:NACHT domain-containing protein n=1 Tax=Tetrapyrgos nigripes TaxID=182062 RepID=A0A8H5GQ78_9AGAR|nr:hypothetical protein D9758_002827 [Tetrapyrgos nigripes]